MPGEDRQIYSYDTQAEKGVELTIDQMSGATFSPCGKYRHLLWRRWNASKPVLNLLMLNPSVANATQGDATVTRQIKRAGLLGFGALLVTNAYDLISTDPKVLKDHPCPLSPENNAAILAAAREAHDSGGKCIAGWGRHCTDTRSDELVRMFEDAKIPLYCLALNDDMSPSHPLYIPYDAPLLKWPVF